MPRGSLEESRKDLLDIVAAWSHACNLERFFEDLARRANELHDREEREAFLKRIERARELVGGTDVLRYFGRWRALPDRLSARRTTMADRFNTRHSNRQELHANSIGHSGRLAIGSRTWPIETPVGRRWLHDRPPSAGHSKAPREGCRRQQL